MFQQKCRPIAGCFSAVGVRLKGNGSFQPMSGKPSLALKFNAYVPGQRLFGLSKILLNNARQDSSLMSEFLAASLFQEAGVPAAQRMDRLLEILNVEMSC